jgi:hypothetical protein
MAVDGPLTVFAMDISKPPVSEGFPNTPGAGSPQRESDLTIHFEFFDEIGGPGLFQMMTIGPLANHDKLESLRRSVDDHPTWSDTQVIETMESSGARFGPDKKGALIAQLHLDRLGAILGPIHVHSAEFNLRNEAARQNNLESAELVWRVQISAGTQRRKLDYVLMAEPFDGKVIGIVRLPAHGKK